MIRFLANRARGARRDQKGFTLIELLIVIVILGILAAIVVFSVRGIQNRGDHAACQADVATTETAIEAYYAKKSAWPNSLAVLYAPGADQFLRSAPAYVLPADYDNTTGAVSTTCPA